MTIGIWIGVSLYLIVGCILYGMTTKRPYEALSVKGITIIIFWILIIVAACFYVIFDSFVNLGYSLKSGRRRNE